MADHTEQTDLDKRLDERNQEREASAKLGEKIMKIPKSIFGWLLGLGALFLIAPFVPFVSEPAWLWIFLSVIFFGSAIVFFMTQLKTVPASNPTSKAVVTYWGKRYAYVLDEGDWFTANFWPFRIDFIVVSIENQNLDFVYTHIRCKDESAPGTDDEVGKDSVLKLLDAVDKYIPQPKRQIDKPFLMPIEDVFSISGRGTVVTGRIEQGIIKVGDNIEIVGIKETAKTVCTGVEMFRKLLDRGEAGDNLGALLRGTGRDEVERGQVLAKPGSITPHTKFESEVYVLSKEEGGRHTPFFNNYRPQFYFRTTDVTGSIELPKDVGMVMPGDNTKFTVTLGAPIAMVDGLRFAIREGGRTVGSGVVTKILE